MSTEKVSDQIKVLRGPFDNNCHAFFNAIVDDIADKLREAVPGLVIKKSGAELSSTGGSIVLMGKKAMVDDADHKETTDRVRHTMDGINSDFLNG